MIVRLLSTSGVILCGQVASIESPSCAEVFPTSCDSSALTCSLFRFPDL